MTERSGIDMIEELLDEVNRLSKKVDIMERLLKQVANSAKISEVATAALNTPLSEWAKQSVKIEPYTGKPKHEGRKFKFEPTDAAKIKQAKTIKAPATKTACMCNGKMVISSGTSQIPLPSISVRIYNDKDELVKTTKTNRAGVWRSQLSEGKYVALYEGKFGGKDLCPINKNFVVEKGMKTLEVK